jgi:hypothetical protein
MFGEKGKLVSVYEGMDHTERERLIKSMKIIDEYSGLVASCPWCLYIGTLDQFTRINEKTGAINTLFECPDCYQNMKQNTTIVFDEGPKVYSEWFWEQVFTYHQYERISWDKIKRRVKIIGFDEDFWEEYWRHKHRRKNTEHYTNT